MATEKRQLIDANALCQSLEFAKFDSVIDSIFISEAIKNAPTVDAVPVVRCKDCKHYHHYGNDVYGCRAFGMMKTKPDGFCSYGERRTNERKAD